MSLYISGKWLDGDGESFTSLAPYSRQLVWKGGCATTEQVEEAVSAARNAFVIWKKVPYEKRAAIISRFAEIVKEHSDELAGVIAEETGKPLWEAKTEAASVAGKIALSVDAYHQRTGQKNHENNGVQVTLSHRPIGVMAVFGAYNFPCHLPNGHIVPALLAGNTIVFKPSELTPYSGELMIKLWHLAGVPEGVINLVQGGKNTGMALSQARDIDGLLFTGSADTGHLIHQQFGGCPEKMLALEMGGNNPLIVSEHSGKAMEAITYQIIQSAFVSGGQRCTCARRLFVPDSEYGDELIERLCDAIQRIVIDEPFASPQPFMGALISENAADHLAQAQKHLLSIGGKALVLGKRGDFAFFSPALIDVTDIAMLPDEEYFGPLLQVIRYDKLLHAIEMANNTRFGLAAGLISESDQEWELFLDYIRAGIVNRNRPLTGASGSAPFGGPGASGNFRPGAFYAADYCAYPMASMASRSVMLPETLSPGLGFFQS